MQSSLATAFAVFQFCNAAYQRPRNAEGGAPFSIAPMISGWVHSRVPRAGPARVARDAEAAAWRGPVHLWRESGAARNSQVSRITQRHGSRPAGIDHHLPCLRFLQSEDDADGRVPMVLRVHELRHGAAPQAGATVACSAVSARSDARRSSGAARAATTDARKRDVLIGRRQRRPGVRAGTGLAHGVDVGIDPAGSSHGVVGQGISPTGPDQ
jgi:hypothetical protein